MKLRTDHCLVEDYEIEKTAELLHPYIDRLNHILESKEYHEYESSICLPEDSTLFQKTKDVVASHDLSKIKYVIDIGIGGSNLGTKAIYDAAFGFFDSVQNNRYPKMIFLDTINDELLKRMATSIQSNIYSPGEVLIFLISKSGGTTETIANFELLHAHAPTLFEKDLGNVIVITDEGSALYNQAMEKHLGVITIPKPIGGRYSVFSGVGTAPLEAVGINVKEVLEGASTILPFALSKDVHTNPSALSAITQYLQLQKGKDIHNLFIFQSNFESIGKWYRQLMGESIGKELDKDGKSVHTGIVPNLSIGSTDLHSVGQMYLGGPENEMTEFVFASKPHDPLTLPQTLLTGNLIEHIASKSTTTILEAILEGVMLAYEKKGLPFTTLDLEDTTLHSIGAFLQYKMIEMMYLGVLLNVNAFDQPNVESYKTETKALLAGFKKY